MGNGSNLSQLIRWEPTVTLGTIIQLVVIGVTIIIAWVKLSDRIDMLDEIRLQQSSMLQKIVDTQSQLQQNEIRLTVLVDDLDRRMAVQEALHK